MKKHIVVVGGANVDISASSYNAIKSADSNPGKVMLNVGGVGRNIAENISKFDVDISLISSIGNDVYSNLIIENCKKSHIDISHSVFTNKPTGLYICINDVDGDMYVAVSDMEICDEINTDLLAKNIEFINNADLLVIDSNIHDSAIEYIDKNVTIDIACDLVSVAKCKKIKPLLHKMSLLKANKIEAAEICSMDINNMNDIKKAANFLNNLGCKNVIITLGADGAYYSSLNEYGHIKPPNIKVINTTGCGDAFMGTACAFYVKNKSITDIVKYGISAATITALSTHSVAEELSLENINKYIV